jgi:hypothetical protein
MKQHQIDLGRIFELERLESDRRFSPFSLLSAAGGSSANDADYSERLKLLRTLIRENKRICKPGGGIYSDQELLSMPFDKFNELYGQAESADSTNITGAKIPANDGKTVVNLTSLFNMENSLTLLSARVGTSKADRGDATRYSILKNMLETNRIPRKPGGSEYFTAEELAAMDLGLLEMLNNNCVPTTRAL